MTDKTKSGLINSPIAKAILDTDKIDVYESGKLYENYTGRLHGYEFRASYALHETREERIFLKLAITCLEIQPNSPEVNVQVKMECKVLGIKEHVHFLAPDGYKNGSFDWGKSLVANALLRQNIVQRARALMEKKEIE